MVDTPGAGSDINAADLDGFAAGLVGFDIDGAAVDNDLYDGEIITTQGQSTKVEVDFSPNQRM